jgi:hypothetical protein
MQWLQIFNQILVGLITFIVMSLALFGIKKFPPGPPIAIVLLLITILFIMKVRSKFTRPMHLLSIHAASDLDRSDTVRAPAELYFFAIVPFWHVLPIILSTHHLPRRAR